MIYYNQTHLVSEDLQKLLKHVNGFEPDEEEIWDEARQFTSPPSLENIYNEHFLRELRIKIELRFEEILQKELEIDISNEEIVDLLGITYHADGKYSHFYINEEEVFGIKDYEKKKRKLISSAVEEEYDA